VRIDLHTHSTVSDGTEGPAELLAAARAAGLDVVALTDHDSTAGWQEAGEAARELGIALVPGMEVSCQTANGISVHLLSYLHDPAHPGLVEEIMRSCSSRDSRAQHMVERLSEDYPITWTAVQEHTAPGATIGRPHIADAMVALKIVRSRSEAFEDILSSRSRYYVSHYAPDPVHAVELVRAAGGVPVFAHPVASARGRVVDDGVMADMIDAGLLGVEVDHRDNPEAARPGLRALAERHGLLVTGSSDYHGTGKPNRLGENLTSADVLERIEALGTGTPVVR
jgi:predicted metal-dependent phosphoesterase TrpH